MPPPIDKGKRKAPVNPAQTSGSIDEIFASSSSKPAQPGPSSVKPSKGSRPDSERVFNGSVAISKKKKKRKTDPEDGNDVDDQELLEKQGEVRNVQSVKQMVETIVDPSTVKAKPEKEAKKRSKRDIEEDEAFRDTRGNRRKTEEGFLIYKEAELGINPETGGTPLCPFDCDCCF